MSHGPAHHSPRRVLAVLLAVLLLLGWSIPPAGAIKWPAGCPTTQGKLIHAGGRLYVAAPFVHPGHELGFFLDAREVRRSGGFSLEPDGNTVEIAFRPLAGGLVRLPAFAVTAASASALYFPFPDTQSAVGRIVAGPMDITVRSGKRVRRARRVVALPPGNDVLALLQSGVDATALATVDEARRLWIPLEFGGLGPGMPMPMCPVELTQKTAFAVRLVPDEIDVDDVLPHASYTNLRKAKLFFGDFLLNGVNVYGWDTGSTLDVRELNRAAIVCGLNDALSLVLMVRLNESALGPTSRILPVVKDGKPLPLALANVSGEPAIASQLQNATEDSFGNRCAPRSDSR
jgi:hypothetical protein